MRNGDVTNLQTYLSYIGEFYTDIPRIPVTGYYGDQTAEAVRVFQRLFGLPETGAVGAVAWNEIAKQYDFLRATEN